MKKRIFCAALCTLLIFLLWTAAIQIVDVRPIGPRGTAVGFASINRFMHGFTGVHMGLYTLTDRLSLVSLMFVMDFGILGLVQWIDRKQLLKVDHDILMLGVFYVIVLAAYALFEVLIVNYRPVLIDGRLEASYPSSTTMLVMCVMPTAAMQLNARIKNGLIRRWVSSSIIAFTVFMVVGRFLSGVHWFTDIIGGALLSTGLVLLYKAMLCEQ